ncbi:MAG: hypothetical protein E7K85_18360 [Clostridium sp.]|uniref:hypothetical protein n=1 Tax=Clostridium TaxID=1485 RepID=UPI000C07D693|nr:MULTISPECIES: hypothetical protein [Clostridium]MDB2122287.1 hypothetical protein [Clostridium paraputrificum]MDU1585347.1 hypothetical protein [Clostridium sp.]MDU1978449.1 hypothetical protein [Clostridium sp.]MDU1994753.1 hypothetical protein [Clostridium sp.]MDU4429289.1 hypothetical protein [Clostridium sp.]
MHFIEVLLGLSVFTFLFALIPLILINNESKLNDLIVGIEVISIILIVICLILYICNALMTCITIWFGNW